MNLSYNDNEDFCAVLFSKYACKVWVNSWY